MPLTYSHRMLYCCLFFFPASRNVGLNEYGLEAFSRFVGIPKPSLPALVRGATRSGSRIDAQGIFLCNILAVSNSAM